MADAEDLGDSEIEPVPVTPLSCDHPECSRTSILDKLKPPTKLDLAHKRNTFNSLLCQHMLLCQKVPIMLKIMLA